MEIKGIISKITNRTIQGKILCLVSTNKGIINVLAKKSLIQRNMPVSIEGSFEHKYFVAKDIRINFFNAAVYAKYLSTKTKGCGLGLKTIQKFTNEYKSKLLTISKEELREKILTDFSTINIAKLDNFLELMYRQSTIALLEDFFEDYKVDYEILQKIDEEYGMDAIKKFKTNKIHLICFQY